MNTDKAMVLLLSALLSAPVLASTASDRAYQALQQPLSQRVTQQQAFKGTSEAAISAARRENRVDDSDGLIKARHVFQQPVRQMTSNRAWQQGKTPSGKPSDW